MAGIGCQSCGKTGVATHKRQCANEKCVKKTIQVCLGCQANAVNQRTPIRCRTCQNTSRPKRRKGVGISSHNPRG